MTHLKLHKSFNLLPQALQSILTSLHKEQILGRVTQCKIPLDNSFFKLGRRDPGTVLCYSRTNSCFLVIPLLFLCMMKLPDSLSIEIFRRKMVCLWNIFATFVFVLKAYTQAHSLGCVFLLVSTSQGTKNTESQTSKPRCKWSPVPGAHICVLTCQCNPMGPEPYSFVSCVPREGSQLL